MVEVAVRRILAAMHNNISDFFLRVDCFYDTMHPNIVIFLLLEDIVSFTGNKGRLASGEKRKKKDYYDAVISLC